MGRRERRKKEERRERREERGETHPNHSLLSLFTVSQPLQPRSDPAHRITTHQSLANLQQHIGVVQSSAMILPCQLDVCAGFGILPWYVVILSVIRHWSDRRRQRVDEWVLAILTNLIHYLTWQSLSINCVTIVT